jgi:DNA-binding CsgD family transcriptional regulator
MLVGRRIECDVLDELLEEVRGGYSCVLVVRGEPGVGKTALADYAMESASGFRIAHAAGVESEAELAFAALKQLCTPMLDRIEDLPRPQRDALGAALGLSAGGALEPYLVGLAVLSLLSGAAQERPLLCIVDDAHWLDRASAQALAFVARRLLADRVAFLFATRAASDDLTGLPELRVDGLAAEDARTLLASAIDAPLDERARDRIIAEARGNPLALLELPRGLTVAELAVGIRPGAALPLAARIEESFVRRLAELPVDTRRLVLVAAADQLGDPGTLWRAAARLGIGADAAPPAAAAGLVDIGADVRFRHPLVRSAVYTAASPDERREVHRALAEATDAELDPDRRAWHLAEATPGPDEHVAAELERSAGRARERGGLAAAAAFLERSAELTPDPATQALRRLLAAGADLAAGSKDRARGLLEQSVPRLADPAARAQAMRIEGALRFADGRGGDTPTLLFDAAMALRDVDPRLARDTLMHAIEAAMWAGGLATGTTLLEVAQAARTMPAPEHDARTPSLMLTGYSERLTTGYAAAVDWWRRAADALAAEVREDTYQWHGMVWNATGELFDFETHIAVARERVQMVREQGALTTLPVSLSCLAWCERLAGRIAMAESLTAEAREIASAIDSPAMPGAHELMNLAMLAWRGRDQETRAVAQAVAAEARARGQGLAATLAQFCLTTLHLGHGRYEEARAAALVAFDEDPLYIGSIYLADVVEAAVRSGDRGTAQIALERLTERAPASATPWALGLLARARALVAAADDAEPFHLDAIDHLERSGVATDLARTHLLYGEWLRRQGRNEAATQLRLAHEMLQSMGGTAFANRARVELLAIGEQAGAAVSDTHDGLTPREQQIALLAVEGESDAEIAAELFLSPHTVDYHLRNVFDKLGIDSRDRLAGALGDEVAAVAPSG